MRAVMTKTAREGVPDVVSQIKFGIGIGTRPGPWTTALGKSRRTGGTAPWEQSGSSPRHSSRGPGPACPGNRA
jgi:hypothetical protein